MMTPDIFAAFCNGCGKKGKRQISILDNNGNTFHVCIDTIAPAPGGILQPDHICLDQYLNKMKEATDRASVR